MKRWLEYLLLIAGVGLLLIYAGARVDREQGSRARIRAFRSQQAASQTIPGWQHPQQTQVKFDLWSAARVKHYEESLRAELQPPLAILRAPKIELEVPVLDSTDELSLNRGVGWIAGTARPGEAGNTGIAGHRDGFFRGLKDIAVGDRLELEMYDTTHSYMVDSIEIVAPTDTRVLAARKGTSLTLVTCYPFYFVGDAPQRYIVHASLEAPQDSELRANSDLTQTKQNQENRK